MSLAPLCDTFRNDIDGVFGCMRKLPKDHTLPFVLCDYLIGGSTKSCNPPNHTERAQGFSTARGQAFVLALCRGGGPPTLGQGKALKRRWYGNRQGNRAGRDGPTRHFRVAFKHRRPPQDLWSTYYALTCRLPCALVLLVVAQLLLAVSATLLDIMHHLHAFYLHIVITSRSASRVLLTSSGRGDEAKPRAGGKNSPTRAGDQRL